MGQMDATEGADPTPSTSESDYTHDPSWSRIPTIVAGEVLPKLLRPLQVDATPVNGVGRAEDSGLHPRFDEFLRLLRSDGSDQAAWTFIEQLIKSGTTTDAIHAELLTPAARRMGALWDEDEADFTEVAIVCNRLQRTIRRMASRYQTGLSCAGPRVLVSALPGAHHTLGPLIVAEALSGQGLDVSIGEPFISDSDPRDFSVVAISIARAEEIEEAQAFMHDLRTQSPEIRIIVGGAAFREDPSMVTRIGADGWAEDAQAAATLVHELTSASDLGAAGAS